MKNKIQNSTVLVLGSNPLSKKDLNYELLNLKYLPSLDQVLALKPNLLIVNFNSYKSNYHAQLIELCENLKKLSALPIILIEDQDKAGSEIEDHIKNLFENIWSTSFSINQASDQINALLTQDNSETEEFLAKTHNSEEKELKFQENIFLNCLSPINLETHFYSSYANTNKPIISGNFFKIIDLSASQVGIFFAEIKSSQAIKAFLTGYLLAEINTLINTEQKQILWSANSLLSKLSDSLYEVNKDCSTSIKAWYGIVDLGNLKINYASAGKLSPLLKTNSLKTEIQSELGLKAGMVYHEANCELEAKSNFLFYTDNLINNEQLFSQLENISQEVNAQDENKNLENILKDFSNEDYLVLYCKLKENREIHCLADSFSEILPQIDEILNSLPENLNPEIVNETEIALQELFFKAYTKIQRSRLIESFNEEADQIGKQLNLFSIKGFKANWWLNSDKLDISIYLHESNIPWSWNNKLHQDLEGISDLILFFDNIQIHPNQREITMSKSLF